MTGLCLGTEWPSACWSPHACFIARAIARIRLGPCSTSAFEFARRRERRWPRPASVRAAVCAVPTSLSRRWLRGPGLALPRRWPGRLLRRSSSAARSAIRSSSVINRQTVDRRDPDRRTWPAASSSRSSFRVGLYRAPVCSAIAFALNPAEVSASNRSSVSGRSTAPRRRGRVAVAAGLRGARFGVRAPPSSRAPRTGAGVSAQLAGAVAAGCGVRRPRVGRGREPVVVVAMAPAGTRPSVRGPSSAAFAASSTVISAARSARRPSIAASSWGMSDTRRGYAKSTRQLS